MEKIKDYRLYLAFLALFLILLPVGNLLGLVSTNTISLWGRYFCFAIVAIGVDLIWGYTGILSMCQAFFFCLGGYALAMHIVLSGAGASNGSDLPDFMVWNQVQSLPFFWVPFQSFGLAIILGLLIPAAFAFVFGYFIFRSRIKGVYMAIITQALALAMWLLFLRNETMLGGTNGLTDFKSLLGFSLSAANVKLGLYLLSLILLCCFYYLSKKLVNSKFGKVLQAIRDSESRTSYTAYRVLDYKLAIFIFSAVLAAVAGMLYAPQTGIITPGRMDVKASVEMVMWVALGGRGKLKGAILGALTVNFLYSICTSLFPDSWLFILGFLFVITVLYFDKGFFGAIEALGEKLKRKPVPGRPVSEHESVQS
ncbi:urea ABC transporter permease subunit UrtC [Dyadobacter pollutisoli]|uniref:Urea ABC transporter permease subunit UrtC n=1 Tax=Dyadobacter pollutisoli TaxID=2910158 RepID=A0A9E8NGQ5_9BACT|nr:urea ABC transporter permease subunit UrtC [Dyadobacter pollutisoli]WAC14998.1 urea ABC transporter permease subunit UrtC [Dyadobacter pollutisoli]